MSIIKFFNLFFFKNSKNFYAEPLKNCMSDKYDLINASGDSLLSFLNYLINNYDGEKIKIFLVCYDKNRNKELTSFAKKNPNIKFVFIYNTYNNFFGKYLLSIKKLYYQFVSKTFLLETILSYRKYLLKSQKLYCLSYFTSFKSDLNLVPSNQSPKNWEMICSTSKLDSLFKSASYYVEFNKFMPVGLPRNDSLINNKDNFELKNKILKYYNISSCSKIILYAPTYRDTKINNGYADYFTENFLEKLSEYLEETNSYFITKLHSWQNHTDFIQFKRVLCYVPTYDFSFYDVMSISDLMITDYSSIGLDWCLLDKPIIFYLYDYKDYSLKRGFSFEPFDMYCPGNIVYNAKELLPSIIDELQNDSHKEKRHQVKKMAFLYDDNNTCKRVYNYMFRRI